MSGVFAAVPLGAVRVFLSPDNPLGFGISDFFELAAAAVLVFIVLSRPWVQPAALKLAQHAGWCMLLLAALPVGLRLALLPQCPAPTPSGSDDFSYILLADTLRHFRLANPPHALAQFFEQIFVLQQPSYSSMYPLGQGLILALGWLIFGHPWAGVLLSIAALCSLCYWMLRAWTTPGWAFAGGLLAVFEFGPLSYWTNSYWGGAVSACAGCLVFGALPRLRESHRTREGAWLGLGLAIQLLTRPYEFFLLLTAVALFLVPRPRDLPAKALLMAMLVVLAGGAAMLFQNKKVTDSWTTLPYLLYRYQYGVPATFTIQPNAVPHRQLNAEQELDYRAETAIHGEGADTLARYLDRLVFRARFYRFFFFAPLYLAVLAFLVSIREYRFVWVLLTILVFALGSNFFPYFYPHYIAAITCLFVLISVIGLERLSQWRPALGSLLMFLCAALFFFWYGVHALGGEQALFVAAQYETWDYINYGDPQGRISINNQLARLPGKQLVFVRYGPRHRFQEWVHNAADIDSSRIVWAHDLGSAEDEKLREYYPDRTAWVLEPDATPPKLSAYATESSPFLPVP